MAKDSYQRFLKSEHYLQILNDSNLNINTSDSNSGNVIMRSEIARKIDNACKIRRHTCVPDQSETFAIQQVNKINSEKNLASSDSIQKISE